MSGVMLTSSELACVTAKKCFRVSRRDLLKVQILFLSLQNKTAVFKRRLNSQVLNILDREVFIEIGNHMNALKSFKTNSLFVQWCKSNFVFCFVSLYFYATEFVIVSCVTKDTWNFVTDPKQNYVLCSRTLIEHIPKHVYIFCRFQWDTAHGTYFYLT